MKKELTNDWFPPPPLRYLSKVSFSRIAASRTSRIPSRGSDRYSTVHRSDPRLLKRWMQDWSEISPKIMIFGLKIWIASNRQQTELLSHVLRSFDHIIIIARHGVNKMSITNQMTVRKEWYQISPKLVLNWSGNHEFRTKFSRPPKWHQIWITIASFLFFAGGYRS